MEFDCFRLCRAAEPQADNAPDHKDDAKDLPPIQPLSEEQCAQDGDSDACDGCPHCVADADIESQKRETEEEGGDRAADERSGGPPRLGKTLCIPCGNCDRDLKDHGDAQIQPMHDYSPTMFDVGGYR